MTFHPFIDGNKRMAFQLSLAKLRANGYDLVDNNVTHHFIRDVASGMYDREEIEDWLRRNARLSNL